MKSIAWSAELLTLAARFANARAVSDGNETISYSELARRAHALAARLAWLHITPGLAHPADDAVLARCLAADFCMAR